MQNQHLKLKEIIWEITGECKNGCSYCGSKDVTNKKTNKDTIIKIAKEIAKYPPEEIDMSGGDPLLVPVEVHREILQILKEKGIKCKILANPNSLLNNSDAFDILGMYDWIGVSINTKSELDKFIKYTKEVSSRPTYTIITNFNIVNLYEFDLIEAFVKEQDNLWTIQFTIYNDENSLALYNNDSALEFLQNKINKSDARILLSDNIRNDNSCGAGLCSVGITYDGYVIPCLSMRSWCNPVEQHTLSILNTSLENIWINGFKEQRFGQFKCCKDVCKNKCIFPKADIIKIQEITKDIKDKTLKEFLGELQKNSPQIIHDRVVIYGVQDNQTIMYAVYPGYNRKGLEQRLVYGVADFSTPIYSAQIDLNATDKTSTDDPK